MRQGSVGLRDCREFRRQGVCGDTRKCSGEKRECSDEGVESDEVCLSDTGK